MNRKLKISKEKPSIKGENENVYANWFSLLSKWRYQC